MKLKFATWNIACGAGGYHGQAIADIARWIVAQNIDICVLQEVDRFAKRSNYVDFPKLLAQNTKLTTYFEPSFTVSPEQDGAPPREYGNCILSRFPVMSTHYVALSPANLPETAQRWEIEPRAALAMRLDCGGGTGLWVATAHLSYVPDFASYDFRKRQVAKLVDWLRRMTSSSDALLFGGDLNSPPDGEDIKLLREYLTLHTGDIGPTWPLGGTMGEGRAPFVTIDHIFSRKVTVETVVRHDLTLM
ncbi:MAG: endonuclease/exonuclease/phosphatase family protein, partial [Alphaproteobacteria bacterium]